MTKSWLVIGCAVAILASVADLAGRPNGGDGRGRGEADPPPDLVLEAAVGSPADSVAGVAFAPDGQCVAAGTRQGRVCVWTASGSRVCAWQAHADAVFALCFLADSSAVLSAGRGGGLRVWQITDAGPVLRAEADSAGPVLSAAASPDGAIVAIGSVGRVTVWRLGPDGLAPVADHRSPGYPTHAVAVSPDGRQVAAGDTGDGRLHVWRTGESSGPTRLEPVPGGAPRGLRFSRDGFGLEAVGPDGTVHRAGAEGAECLARLRTWGPHVRQAAFAPDGVRVIVAHTDGTARLTSYR